MAIDDGVPEAPGEEVLVEDSPAREVFSESHWTVASVGGAGSFYAFTFWIDWDRVQAIYVEVAWNDTVMDLDATLQTFPDCTIDDWWGIDLYCTVDVQRQQKIGPDPENPMLYENTGGSVGAPDSPSVLQLDRSVLESHRERWCEERPGEECEWYVGAMGEDLDVDVDSYVFATVFYDGPVPEGYTAVPWMQEGA